MKKQRTKTSEVTLEIGAKRGRLTIINEVERYCYSGGGSVRRYKCLCDCGNECYATADTLKRGIEPSCGCALQKRVGDRIGRLTIIAEHEKRGDERMFTVRCDCGAEEVRGLKWLQSHAECLNCSRREELSIINLPGEIWRDVIGYEGLYQVSNMGRVKSLSKYRRTIHEYISKPIILSPRARDRKGYLAVALNKDGKVEQRGIHQLVAKAFVANPNGYTEVNHIDEDKKNNKADNLEYCSRSYNVNYGSRIAKQRIAVIKPVEMLDDSGNVIMEFDSRRTAALHVGVDSSNIIRAIQTNRKAGGYFWRDKEVMP